MVSVDYGQGRIQGVRMRSMRPPTRHFQMFLMYTIFSIVSNPFNSSKSYALSRDVKTILKLCVNKSIVTDDKTTRSKIERIY